MRGSVLKYVLPALVLVLCAQAAHASLVCNGVPVGFEGGLPSGWTVQTNAGAVAWSDRGACGDLPNSTGAGGNAACVSSDAVGPGAYDTELRTNAVDLSAAASAALRFEANYQNFAASDFLDLEASTDGGLSWTQLLHWNEDHGAAMGLPGESVDVDLSAFAGSPDLRFRWRYHDLEPQAYNWYAQIDGVRLLCDASPVCSAPPITNRLTDGGLEGGTPSAAWTEASSNFATPICTSTSCGFAGARTGDAWAFIGGSEGAAELSSLEQSVVLDVGIASLEFYLWMPHASGNGTDVFRVLIDGVEVLAVPESTISYRDEYQRVRINVSSFADGAAHSLRFEANVSGAPTNTNFFVDDISLEICTAVSGQPEISVADIEVVEGDTGSTSAYFVVRLSSPYTGSVQVDFATADGSALAAIDYTATAGTLVIEPGETSKEIPVSILGDTDIEGNESFELVLSQPVNTSLPDPQAFALIVGDDALPEISIGDATVFEGGGASATFHLTLSTPSDMPVSVSFATSDGTALAGVDYTAASGVVAFPPGTLTQTIAVEVLGDGDGEAPETFFVDLFSPTNAVLLDAQGLGTIQNDDAPPVLSIANTAVVEGDAASAQALFKLSLTYASHLPITVDFESGDGTALAGADYATAIGTATIPAGAESLTVPVDILGDGDEEPDEDFTVTLSNPINVTLGAAVATGTILDDDLVGDACFGRELLANGSFEQSPAIGWNAVSGSWSQVGAPPIAPVDGVFVAGPGPDPVAELVQDVDISAYASSTDAGLQEFELSGWALSAAAATADATRVVVEYRDAANLLVLETFDSGNRTNSVAWEEIEDRRLAPSGTRFIRVRLVSTLNDGATNDTFYDAFSLKGAKRPALDADGVRVFEGSGVSVDATFELRLSCGSEADVTVAFSTADGTATAGSDYVFTSGNAVFSAGSTSESVIVSVLADAQAESEEAFELLLTAPANVENRAPSVAATIIDVAAPTLSVGDVVVVEGDAGVSDALFPVTLSSAFAHDVSVTFGTVDGTARAGTDYQATVGTLVIPAGTVTAAIPVPVIGDLQAEGDESFDLELSSPVNSLLSTPSARATIQNDDERPRLLAGSVSVSEGGLGSVIAQIPVTLTTPVDLPVTARFDLRGTGTAYRDVDFVQVGGPALGGFPIGLPPGTVRIPAGELSAVIEVEVLSDGLPEGDEHVAVILSEPMNAQIFPDDSIGILTIVDDDSTCVSGNLIENPGGEELLLGNLVGWTVAQGFWRQLSGNSPYPLEGDFTLATFDFGVGVTVYELIQDVDVTAFATEIATGGQPFVFEGFVRTHFDDDSRIFVEYRDGGGTALAEFDSGNIVSPFRWEQVTDLRIAPVGTEFIRIRLLSVATFGGVSSLYDALSLRAVGTESVSISDTSVFEEDGVATLEVVLSCAATGVVTVDFATVDGTALAGSDYLPTTGTLTFAPGEVRQEIEVTLIDDSAFEGNGSEDFFVELSNISGAAIGVSSGRVRIRTGAENPLLDLLPARIREGDAGTSTLFFTVFLDRPPPTDVTADFSARPLGPHDGPVQATPGVDYVEPSGTLTIPAGETVGTVAVQIIGDLEDEPAEGFRLNLSNATGALFAGGFGGDFAVATIEDDDGSVFVSIADVSRREFDRGLHDLNFTVTMSKPIFDADAAIDYSTSDLTALAGGDYFGKAGTLIIPAGETVGVITIQTIGNQEWDGRPSTPGASQFSVDLGATAPSQVVIADGQAIGSLIDDDKYIQRFETTERGAIVFTGNTLGLSKGTDSAPGTLHEIGVFTTTDTSLQVGTYPPGTTQDWTQNSSNAVLDLPPGAEVLHAELIWGGTAQNLADPVLDTAVLFTGPDGASILVLPDPITARRSSSLTYMRSADVTSFVSEQAGGLYELGGVFATLPGTNTSSRHAGWTLAVVYSDAAEPARNLSLMVGMATCRVSGNLEDSLDLITPSRRPLSGRMAVSAADGDAVLGETFRLFPGDVGNSPNSPPFDVSGPNNPVGQFWSSQINDGDGLLDTRGTFGDLNHIPGVMTVGGRQGWDITEVDISNTLAPGLSEIALYAVCSDVWPNAFGFEIDLAGPTFAGNAKTVNRTSAPQGDSITYSVDLSNNGVSDAEELVFFDPPPAGTSFVPGSFVFNGVPVPSADPAAGVPLGTVAAGSQASVSFQVELDVLPPEQSSFFFVNQARWTYQFRADTSAPFEYEEALSNRVSTRLVDPLVASKTVNLFADLDGNALVTPGDVLRYEITATNNRVGPLDNLTIQDSVPAILEILPASILVSQGTVVSENPLVVDIGQLAGLSTVTVSFLARVPDNVTVTASALSNQATVVADGIPPVITDDPVGDGTEDGTEIKVLLSPFVPDNQGTLFHLAFMENFDPAPLLRLLITGDLETAGVVEIPGFDFVQDFTVTPGEITSVELPPGVEVATGSEGVEPKGVRVTSEEEVTVYGVNQQFATTDAFLGIPTDVAGTDYLTMTYLALDSANGSEIAVVGTENDTTVTVTPRFDVAGHPAGVPFEIQLNELDVYSLEAAGPNEDLTGTVISSDKPVSVFSGNVCAYVPLPNGFCDHLVEQIPPTTTWGTSFLTTAFATRTSGDLFRVLARDDNTEVRLDGVLVAMLDSGEFHEFALASGTAHEVGTTLPSLLAQFAKGTSTDGVIGDPSMVLIPPTQQFRARYTVATLPAGTQAFANYINFVVPTGDVPSCLLDNQPLAATFSAIGTSGFSWAQEPVSMGTHNASCAAPFGIYSYGWAVRESYAYAGGLGLLPIAVSETPALTAEKTDLLVVDEDNDGRVSAGDVLEYRFVVANSGTDTATDVTLIDIVPPETLVEPGSVTTSQGTVFSEIPVQVQLGDLAPAAAATVTFRVRIADVLPQSLVTLSNQGFVTSAELAPVPTDDPDLPGDSDPTETEVVFFAKVSVADTAVVEGDAGTVDAIFAVTLNQPATEVVSVAFVTVDGTALAGQDYQASSGVVTFQLGESLGMIAVPVLGDTLFEGDEFFEIRLAAPVGVEIGDGVGIGLIVGDDGNPIVSASKTDALFADNDGSGDPSPGDEIEYSIEITNTGGPASGVTLTDLIPAHTSVVPGSVVTTVGTVTTEDPVAVDIGALGQGGTATVTFRVVIASPVPAGVEEIVNQGVVTSNEMPAVLTDDPDLGGDADPTVTMIMAMPDLIVEKTDSLVIDADGDGVPSPGDTLEYVVTFKNNGNTSVTGVVFDDPIPLDVALLPGSVTTSQGTVESEDPIQISVGEIAGGMGMATVGFQVVIDNPIAAGVTEIVNQGIATSVELPPVPTDDPDVGGSADPTGTHVVAAPELVVEKLAVLFVDADGDGLVSPGDAVLYSLGIRNVGNTAATAVVLSDLIPADTTVEIGSVQTSQGVVVSEDPVEVQVGEIAGGSSATVSFRVNVNNPFPETATEILNQAVVTSVELPEVLSNDPATPTEADPTVTEVFITPDITVGDVFAIEADAAAAGLVFPVTLSVAPNRPGSVDFAATDGTATAGADYQSTSGTLSFAAGQTSASITVLGLDDSLHEADETVLLDLTNVTGATLSSPQAIGTVLDDDPAPAVALGDATVLEGNVGSTNAVFALTLSVPSGLDVAVGFVTADGSATAGSDYTAVSGSAVIPAGATGALIAVPVSGDLLYEADEIFVVDLVSFTNAIPADPQGLGTILNDDAPPVVSIDDVTVVEVDSGSVDAAFTVSLSAPSALETSVSYATADQTAVSGVDYSGVSGILVIPPGATTGMVLVPVLGDLLDESDETFLVDLSSPSNAVLGDGQGVATIQDDDPPPSVSIADVSVTEGDAGTVDAIFVLTLSQVSGRTVTLDFATADGTAVSGSDYTASSGTISVPAGASSASIAVSVLGDTVDEVSETFTVSLSNPVNATLTDAQAVGTIVDDDTAPVLSIADVTVNEADGVALFTLTLSSASSLDVSVDYTTVDGTATAGADYLAAAGTLVIPAGATSGTVSVPLVDDAISEPEETFAVDISSAVNAGISDSQGVATIVDDDLAPIEITIGDEAIEEGDSGTRAVVLTVSLSRAPDTNLTIDYTTVDESASAGVDYTAATAVLTVPAAATSATLAVSILGDVVLEDDETFGVELSNPSDGVLTDAFSRVTILDDELCLGPNLLRNPGAEETAGVGDIPGWAEVVGVQWQQRSIDPLPAEGAAYFFAGQATLAELSQDIDLSAYAAFIVGGEQEFSFSARIRTFDEIPSDIARVIVEYRDATNTFVLDAFDTGELTSPTGWTAVSDVRAAPAGTGWARVRLLTTRFSTDPDSDGYFDDLKLRSLRTPVLSVGDTAQLEGDVGSSPALFALALSCALPVDVAVAFATTDGTALAGADYIATVGSAIIPAGETASQVSVPVLGDTLVEPDEVFFLDISGSAEVVVVEPRAIGVIIDDESELPPDCMGAFAQPSSLWPPNHKYRGLEILGVTDPEGQEVTLEVTAVFQDEPVDGVADGNTSPDAELSPLRVRAERSGQADGRVYHIIFTATDSEGASCQGTVSVCVPHDLGDQGAGAACVDGGPLFDSTLP